MRVTRPDIKHNVDLFEEYLRDKKGLADSSIHTYGTTIKEFLKRDPDLSDPQEYAAFIVRKTRKKRSNADYYSMKLFINFSIEDLQLKTQILSSLPPPKTHYGLLLQRKYLTNAQIREVIFKMKWGKHQIMALIQATVGLRAGDVLNIVESGFTPEFYEDSETLSIHYIGKGGVGDKVNMFGETYIDFVLEHVSSNEGYLDHPFITLTNPNKENQTPLKTKGRTFADIKRINYQWYRVELKNALELCGHSNLDFSTHDFRRCYARDYYRKYKDPYGLKGLLNHKRYETTLRYLAHDNIDNRQRQKDIQNLRDAAESEVS